MNINDELSKFLSDITRRTKELDISWSRVNSNMYSWHKSGTPVVITSIQRAQTPTGVQYLFVVSTRDTVGEQPTIQVSISTAEKQELRVSLHDLFVAVQSNADAQILKKLKGLLD